RCPPSLLLAVRAFSRFTRLPFFSACKVVSCRVSADTSAAKPWLPSSTTVRQAPLTAILSPALTSLKSSWGLSMRNRHSALCMRSSPSEPSASMIPVNIDSAILNSHSFIDHPCCDTAVPGNTIDIDDLQTDMILHIVQPRQVKQRQGIAAQQPGPH